MMWSLSLFCVLLAAEDPQEEMVGADIEAVASPDAKVAEPEAEATDLRSRRVLRLDDEIVEGELMKPQGAYIVDRKLSRFTSLIQTRTHFRAELRESMDAL